MTGSDGAGHPVVVVGGSVAGLAAALALARGGRRVVLLERDRIDTATDVEEAFVLDRAGAPQAHQTHGFLARLVLLLRSHFPDVLAAMLDAGSQVVPLTRELPDVVAGDEDLAILVARRTTFEWVLRRAAEREPGVEIRGGTPVAGVVGTPGTGSGDPARVSGVILEDGSLLEAGAVVLATGRRGGGPAWLAELGVDVREVEQATGHLYMTRWYRFATTVDLADHPRLGGDLGYLKFLAIPGDGGTLSATLAVRTSDSELRGLLADPGRFDAALGALEGPRALLEEAGAEPIGPVLPMAGLINRIRRFVDGDGNPTVLGLHAVGDAHTCTNPLYGRGCTLAVLQATLLAESFATADGDAARTRHYESGCAREVEPWYHSSVLLDTYRPPSEGGAGADDPFARVFGEGRTDPVIGRAFLRTFNLLWRPDELLADAAFMARAAEIIAAPPRPLPVDGPTRAELLAIVGGGQTPG